MSLQLTGAGVDPFDEDVYRALLIKESASPAELAAELGHSTERVSRALDRLRDQGLVGRMSGHRRRYAAIEPQGAITALVRARTAELDRVRSAAATFSELFLAARHGGDEEVEIVEGREALGRWFVRLQQEAVGEVLTLDRPPYALTTSNPVQQSGMSRGVKYRAVYAPEALTWPGVLDDIRHLVRHGEQARVLPGLRIKLAIADRRIAVFQLSLDLGDGLHAAVVRPSALLDALVDYWEMCWKQAMPLSGLDDSATTATATDGTVLDAEDRLLLTLLVSGLKDEAIARQLNWSIRTMRRRMSRLLEALGAANRFQAGAIAAQRGWIEER